MRFLTLYDRGDDGRKRVREWFRYPYVYRPKKASDRKLA